MWPWEHEPHSVAHGILDDETYDWLAVVEGMLDTGGQALVVDERTLLRANELGRETAGVDVDPTGSAGLAGLLALCEAGEVGDDERVAVLFTGVARPTSTEREGASDEKLPRARHPVAQGLRAG
jgi:threonine synthase